MEEARRACLVVVLACAAWLAGCGGSEPRVWSVLGVVQEVQRDYDQLVIAHDDIPGLMPAMTMNFDVADPTLLEDLEAGQRIRFELEFTGRAYRVRSIEVVGEDEAGDGARLAELAAAADPAPDFVLVDQDGRRRSLAEWRGRAVLLDFIYTRCSGPCPVLTGVHVAVQTSLPPELRERVWFVSISLDPERDTPEALGAYARARGADLANWSFLTGEPPAVAAVLKSYGVASAPAENGEIDHIVATFLLDAEGRIARVFTGMDHDAASLASALRNLAARAG